MTLLEEIPTGRYREASIPVLETKRIALRAARLEDAKAVAALANDRRIAENTARNRLQELKRRRQAAA